MALLTQTCAEPARATPATGLTPARRVWWSVAAGVIGASLLGGCGQERAVWAWPAADASVRNGGTMPAAIGEPNTARLVEDTPPVSQGVAVFPAWGFADRAGPEATRLDSVLASRSSDALPGRLAWPSESRSDLRYQRVFRSSRQADVYSFPSQRRDQIRIRVIAPAYPVVRPHSHHGPGW